MAIREGNHRSVVDSRHKGTVTQKMFSCRDVNMKNMILLMWNLYRFSAKFLVESLKAGSHPEWEHHGCLFILLLFQGIIDLIAKCASLFRTNMDTYDKSIYRYGARENININMNNNFALQPNIIHACNA